MSEQTRRERLQADLEDAINELEDAKSLVKASDMAWNEARVKRDQLEREVGDLRVALGFNRDGSERKPRASKSAPVPAEAPQLLDASE